MRPSGNFQPRRTKTPESTKTKIGTVDYVHYETKSSDYILNVIVFLFNYNNCMYNSSISRDENMTFVHYVTNQYFLYEIYRTF